ncbi:hypothetical protein VNO77_23445 [Canavalia gladiata]|uniref:Uncharacterized protein n=1 Tax=Canavalia gladiata TaxID=3824 RepID=A0AAN9L4F5_CANGL
MGAAATLLTGIPKSNPHTATRAIFSIQNLEYQQQPSLGLGGVEGGEEWKLNLPSQVEIIRMSRELTEEGFSQGNSKS